MKIGVQELLQHSVVISINDNRLATFRRRFSAAGLDNPLPRLYPGLQLKSGMYGELGRLVMSRTVNCHLTHLEILKMARFVGMDYICVFEDDAFPRTGIVELLDKYLSDIPDDADIVRLGHLGRMGAETVYDDMFSKFDAFGSHAYIAFSRYYDGYIDAITRDLHADGIAMSDPSRKILTTREMLFMQKSSGFDDNLHNNARFHDAALKQGYYEGFDLSEGT